MAEAKLRSLADANNWEELQDEFDVLEASAEFVASGRDFKLFTYSVGFFVYIIQNEIPACRFLLRRMPNDMKTDEKIAFFDKLTAALSSWDTHTFLEEAEKFGAADPTLSRLLHTCVEHVRSTTVQCIEKLYTNIKVEKVESLLCVHEDRLVSLAGERGWTKKDGVFVLPSASQGNHTHGDRTAAASASLDSITKSILNIVS